MKGEGGRGGERQKGGGGVVSRASDWTAHPLGPGTGSLGPIMSMAPCLYARLDGQRGNDSFSSAQRHETLLS